MTKIQHISCATNTITTRFQCALARIKFIRASYTKLFNMFKTFILACRPYVLEKNTIRMDRNGLEWPVDSAQWDLGIMNETFISIDLCYQAWQDPSTPRVMSLIKRSYITIERESWAVEWLKLGSIKWGLIEIGSQAIMPIMVNMAFILNQYIFLELFNADSTCIQIKELFIDSGQ